MIETSQKMVLETDVVDVVYEESAVQFCRRPPWKGHHCDDRMHWRKVS